MPAIKATNVTAQLQYRALGNPHQAHPETAVGNFFPGLEFNFQNVWKRFFIGLELLEYGGRVIAVDEAAIKASGGETEPQGGGANISTLVPALLASIDGKQTFVQMQGPLENPARPRRTVMLEWSNLLAQIHAEKGGKDQTVECVFFSLATEQMHGPYRLKVRRLIEADTALIDPAVSLPGEITESLCSPWQTDYIGCACYYWASNRPDYVNIQDPDDPEKTTGHNWLDLARGNAADGRPRYTLQRKNLLQHADVMQDWEKKFHFVIEGQDRPDGLVP